MSKSLELPLLARCIKLKAVIFRGPQAAEHLSVTEFQGYSDAWHLNTPALL